MIVAAHPDDEVLGAGGTITRHVQHGDHVTIVILGEGISSRYETRSMANKAPVAELETDAREAARLMGCSDVRLLGLPDNRFDSLNLLDIVKIIENAVAEIQPEIVYTHHYSDLNIDHGITARAVLTACRPLPGNQTKRILAFEVPSATGWFFPEFTFSPTVFVDISTTLAVKVNAMKAYRSEVRPYPHPRSLESLQESARVWGSRVGLSAAEPFVLVRELIP